MNQFVPDWNMEDDPGLFRDLPPTANQRKLLGTDNDELMEILWQNGNVVLHGQNHRKSPAPVNKFKQAQKPELELNCGGSLGNSSTLIQMDETASWFQYPLNDSLESEFCSDFLGEMAPADAICTDKLSNDVFAVAERCEMSTVSESNNLAGSAPSFQEKIMPPPKLHVASSIQQAPSNETSGAVNFSHFSTPTKSGLESNNERLREKGMGGGIQVGLQESSSMITLGSSACGSNQVQNLADANYSLNSDVAGVVARGPKDDAQMRLPSDGVLTNTYEGTVTSSSGASGSSLGRSGPQSMRHQSRKRKERDVEESQCQSEEAEYESIEANKPAQRSKPTGRSRAAEVHNLSERRRRDRINEKMKALQELIPHCNKTDKASMLDEAIEYLKSLQLQVQMMWMGSAISPLMFPEIQQYMSRMGMGMGYASMAPVHSAVHLPRVPTANQSVVPSASMMNQIPLCPPAFSAADLPNQMQNAHVPDAYAHYLRFHHMQPPSQFLCRR